MALTKEQFIERLQKTIGSELQIGSHEEFIKGKKDFHKWGSGLLTGSRDRIIEQVATKLAAIEASSVSCEPAQDYGWQTSKLEGFCVRIQALIPGDVLAGYYVGRIGEDEYGAFGYGIMEDINQKQCADAGTQDDSVDNEALLTKLKTLIAVALADGHVDVKERALLEEFCRQCGLDSAQLSKLLAEKMIVDRSKLPKSRQDKCALLVDVLRMVAVDGRVEDSERRIVAKIAKALGLERSDIKECVTKATLRSQDRSEKPISVQGEPEAEPAGVRCIRSVEVFFEPGRVIAAALAGGSTVSILSDGDVVNKQIDAADEALRLSGELKAYSADKSFKVKTVDEMDHDAWRRFLNGRAGGPDWDRFYQPTSQGRWNVIVYWQHSNSVSAKTSKPSKENDDWNETCMAGEEPDLPETPKQPRAKCSQHVGISAERNEHQRTLSCGSLLQTLEGHTASVNAVQFSSDGLFAVSASTDMTIRMWDLKTSKCVRTFEGHKNEVHSVAISQDSAFLVSGAGGYSGDVDWTARVWDTETGECRSTFRGGWEKVNDVSISPNGRLIGLAGCRRFVHLLDRETGRRVREFSGEVGLTHCVEFSRDGRFLVSAGSDRRTGDVAYTCVWDLASGKCVKRFKEVDAYVVSIATSGDSRLLLSAYEGGMLRVLDLVKGKCLNEFKGHESWITSVALSRDGRFALSGSGDRTVKLWEVRKGKCLHTLEGHTDAVISVAFSPNQCFALSGSKDGTLRLWKLVR